ncbi:MAG: hypothetical protein K2M73_00755 [Lachnospiraceae bacterium]|nr:hypothetical protein [Lachnospiraceae bacterium]
MDSVDRRQNEINKLAKDIINIQKEKAKVFELLCQGNMQKLEDYLEGELTENHCIGKMINNMFSQPPATIEESANNALHFLENLEREKELELSKEKSKSNI